VYQQGNKELIKEFVVKLVTMFGVSSFDTISLTNTNHLPEYDSLNDYP